MTDAQIIGNLSLLLSRATKAGILEVNEILALSSTIDDVSLKLKTLESVTDGLKKENEEIK